MKWLLTNRNSVLTDAINKCQGQSVLTSDNQFQTDQVYWLNDASDITEQCRVEMSEQHDPLEYKLKKVLSALNPNVLCLVPFDEPGYGYSTGAVLKWRQGHNKNRVRQLIVFCDKNVNGRGCVVRQAHSDLVVTSSEEYAQKLCTSKAVALYQEGQTFDHIVDALSYKMLRNYRPFVEKKIWRA